MRNKIACLLVAGFSLASHTFGQKVSQLGYTNTFRSNDLLSVSVKTGSGYATRAVSYGAMSNNITAGIVAGQPWVARDTVTSNGLISFATSLTYGTNTREWNVLAFGATGAGDPAVDSPAFKRCFSNAFYFGGKIRIPRPPLHYVDTNVYTVPVWATSGTHSSQGGAEIFFEGDGKDATLIYTGNTNGIYLDCYGQLPGFKGLRFVDVGSGSNVCVSAGFGAPGVAGMVDDCAFDGYAIGMRVGAHHGLTVIGSQFRNSRIGLNVAGYSDSVFVSARVNACRFGVVIGGTCFGQTAANGGFYHIGGDGNDSKIVVGASIGNVISGYGEHNTNCYIAVGFPPGTLSGESTLESSGVTSLTIQNCEEGVSKTTSNAFVKMYTPVARLGMNNTKGGILVDLTASSHTTNSAWTIENSYYGYAAARLADGTLKTFAQAAPGGSFVTRYLHNAVVEEDSYDFIRLRYADPFVNYFRGGAQVGFGDAAGINDQHAVLNVSSPTTNVNQTLLYLSTTREVNAAKRAKIVSGDWAGSTSDQMLMYYEQPTSGDARLNFGGGSSLQKPIAKHYWWLGSATVAHGGTNIMYLDQGGLQLNQGTFRIVGTNGAYWPTAGAGGRINYDHTTAAYWYDNGSAWIPLIHGGSSPSFTTATVTNGLLVKSNTISAPVLAIGDNWYWSSNGIPHVTYRVAAGTNIIRLVP